MNMEIKLKHMGFDEFMLLLTVLLSLVGFFSSPNISKSTKGKENLKFFVNCINQGGKKSDCFDSLIINSIHGVKNILPGQSFETYQKCIGKIEDLFHKNGFSKISDITSRIDKCYDKAVLLNRETSKYEISNLWTLFVLGVVCFVVWRLRSREKSIIDNVRIEMAFEFESIKDFLRAARENIHRMNNKLFDLEYDNSLWERVLEIEKIQTRLQLLVDLTRKDLVDKISFLEDTINISEVKQIPEEKSPLILETKKKGLLFDLTTDEGMTEWKSYVHNNSNSNIETKIPKLTPPTISPLSSDLGKVNLFDKNGKPFRRVFVPGSGWMTRKKCIEIMKDASSSEQENINSISY